MQTLDPDFGLGKSEAALDPTVALGSSDGTGSPIPGTTVTITDRTTSVSVSCTVDAVGTCLAADPVDYTRLDPAASTRPGQITRPGTFFYDSFHPLAITQSALPAGFRVYPGASTTALIERCSQDVPPFGSFPCDSASAATVTFYDGPLVRLGLTVTDRQTGEPLSGATYQLCATSEAPPVTTAPPTTTFAPSLPPVIPVSVGAEAVVCPGGAPVLAAVTSGLDGRLVFGGFLDPDAGYSAVEISAPRGYVRENGAARLQFRTPTTLAAVTIVQYTPVSNRQVAAPVPSTPVSSTAVTTPTSTTGSPSSSIQPPSSPSTPVTSDTTSSTTEESTSTPVSTSTAALVTTTAGVIAVPGGSTPLPNTGVPVRDMVLIALALLATGTAALTVARRRPHAPRRH